MPESFISPEIRIPCGKPKRNNIIQKLKDILNELDRNYSDLDGIRIENEKGWYLVRESNSEDVLTVRLEGYSQDNFNFILKDLSNIMGTAGVRLPIDNLIAR
ncbi:hypothetical protein [Candidatus Bandiella euplotis]|uniref:Phosphomannomutase/phosphoglucomutase domain protein n=1 Tax=Candidatus Bandiella euplotis TaxID=1664265 RepID=A0ABZ0UM45_9RICK|nr:hypothetical protein [Candidatus Bandiella woodruffii]WPX95999.1 Phosphomannomutase/phosphoglucomutase domain protein [Candidatus Bandiella woodruffii]